jgi:ribosomal subunit interface protein
VQRDPSGIDQLKLGEAASVFLANLHLTEERMKLKSVDRTILMQSSNVDLGDVLPQYARTSILQVAGKYFGRLNTATVHFSKEGPMYRCTVNMQMGALKIMSGEALHKNCYTAFRTALEKVAKQLRRAKRALREDKAERVDKDIILREPVRLRRKAARRAPEIQAVVDLSEYRMPRELERARPNLVAAE